MKSLKTMPILLLMAAHLYGGELAIGSKMPMADAKLKDVSEKTITLKDVRGEAGTVVIFSCNTCPWVKAWEDRYISLADKYQDKGFGFVALNPNEGTRKSGDSFADMKARARKLGYNFYYALDEGSQFARAYGAKTTPHIYVFDANNNLVYRGAIDDNARQPKEVEQAFLADALDALLAGKPVVMGETKAIGCTIKYVD